MAKRKHAGGATPFSVVYIHGIGNKPAPDLLKRQWDVALFGQDVGETSRLAYWADLFHPEPLRAGEKAIRAAGHDAAPFDPAAVAPYGRDAEAFARKLAARIEAENPALSTKRGKGAARVEAKLLPPFLRRALTKWITKEFVRDVAAYFYDKTTAEAMRERLRVLLVPERAPYLLIAHSMGTVIAYDVLHEMAARGAPVAHLLTIGSPLGLKEVEDHVRHPLAVPKGLASWWNAADRFDPIALDRRLSGEYAPKGFVHDVTVENPDRRSFHFWSAHSIDGYLRTAPIRERIADLLGPSARVAAGRAVISKDVVAEMADPSDRIEVLVELDDKIPGHDLDAKRRGLLRELASIVRSKKAAEIDPLRHFVAASLTGPEIDLLAANHEQLGVYRIWKNAKKRSLVESVARALQVTTGRSGYAAGGRGISWAVLDTGVRPDHPHFERHGNIKAHYDCTKPGEPPIPKKGIDKDGHGTHVCAILAGEGRGTHDAKAGMAPECALHVYKVLGDDGSGNDSWIIKALDHVATLNETSASLVIHGVNLSLGGPFDATVYGCGFTPLCKELRRLWRQGVIVCLSAGNEGQVTVETVDGEQDLNFDLSIGDPANLEDAIAVGSVHKEQPHRYGISYFSSRGPTADGRAKPDIVAPGERVISADAGFKKKDETTWYVEMSGTSMACPAISGMIASFLSVRREYIGCPDDVKRILMAHATDLGRDRYFQGAGLANLVKMLVDT
ncbi:MAG TPA: S8 family serine peptidase [Candidatus Polarisedimenticolaceae bacterium]|nr:S8 family serine peptidase [Candidatus Polarisedimenticolaceae bacterium]